MDIIIFLFTIKCLFNCFQNALLFLFLWFHFRSQVAFCIFILKWVTQLLENKRLETYVNAMFHQSTSISDPWRLTYSYMERSKGTSRLIVIGGYTFSKHCRSTNYYCSRKNYGCRAKAKLDERGSIIRADIKHNHPKPHLVQTASGHLVRA